jgi:hypothetical protein
MTQSDTPYLRYTTETLRSWSRLIETANVRTTSGGADVTIASQPPMSLRLVRERGDWKLTLPNVDEREIDMLREDFIFRRVTWAAVEQQTLIFWETARRIQNRTLTDYSAVQRHLTHELTPPDNGEMTLPPGRYLESAK